MTDIIDTIIDSEPVDPAEVGDVAPISGQAASLVIPASKKLFPNEDGIELGEYVADLNTFSDVSADTLKFPIQDLTKSDVKYLLMPEREVIKYNDPMYHFQAPYTPQNLNDQLSNVNGIWSIATTGQFASNSPEGLIHNGNGVFTMATHNGGYGYQVHYGSDGGLRTRKFDDKGWTRWATCYTDKNKPTPADLGAATAASVTDVTTRVDALENKPMEGASVIELPYKELRAYGELGNPVDTQGWKQIGEANLMEIVSDTRRLSNGRLETIKAVKLNDVSDAGLTGICREATKADWQNIYTYGASFGGYIRLDQTNSGGCFVQLAHKAEDDPTTNNKTCRFGFYIRKDPNSNKVKIEPDGETAHIVENTTYYEYNKFELVIRPENGGVMGYLYINEDPVVPIQLKEVTVPVNTGVTWYTGSTGGKDLVSYSTDFGVTIYESSNEVTLTQDKLDRLTMTIIPTGRRNYTITFASDLTGSLPGDSMGVVAQNVGGKVCFTNQDLSAPKALVNGLATYTIDTVAPDTIKGTSVLKGQNIYQFNV